VPRITETVGWRSSAGAPVSRSTPPLTTMRPVVVWLTRFQRKGWLVRWRGTVPVEKTWKASGGVRSWKSSWR
jgi:hypothetical protein